MKVTKYVILSFALLIAIVDVILIVWKGSEATISHQFIEWSYEFPSIPFLMGFLMGHLFWRMKDTDMTKKVSDQYK